MAPSRSTSTRGALTRSASITPSPRRGRRISCTPTPSYWGTQRHHPVHGDASRFHATISDRGIRLFAKRHHLPNRNVFQRHRLHRERGKRPSIAGGERTVAGLPRTFHAGWHTRSEEHTSELQ